jgi:hypothetical protein
MTNPEMIDRRSQLKAMAAFKGGQGLGLVRKDVNLSAATDFIRNSIYSAMLRHTAYDTDRESVDAHLPGVTDNFYQGIKADVGRDS